MKNSLLLILVTLCTFIGLSAQENLINALKDNHSENSVEGYGFEIVKNVETTMVENQGRSGTCWSYAGNSFLEAEMIRAGKEPVSLSKIYTARRVYLEKAKMYVRMHGHLNYADGGEPHDVLNMYKKYGAVPTLAYDGLNYGTEINTFGEMQAGLKGFLDGIIQNKNGKLTKNWTKAFDAVLDSYLGEVPEEFQYNGKIYTPRTFADEVVGLNPEDYIEVANIPAEPLYENIFLPIPDNWSFDYVYNVSMDDLIDIIDNAIDKDYTIGWATDVSEKYFSWKNGVAYVPVKDYYDMTADERENMFTGPRPERTITKEMRQEAFDDYRTTDDHSMHIIGSAKDKEGNEYYVVKNSWGASNDYEGYIFVSKDYVRYKTVALFVNKNALPDGIYDDLKSSSR